MNKIINALRGIDGVKDELAKLHARRHELKVQHGDMAIAAKGQILDRDWKMQELRQKIEKLDEEEIELTKRLEELKSEPAFVELHEKRLAALRGVARDLREQLDASNLDYRLKRSEFALDVLAGADPIKRADELEAIKDQSRRLTRAAEMVQAALRLGSKV